MNCVETVSFRVNKHDLEQINLLMSILNTHNRTEAIKKAILISINKKGDKL
jgi:hypothetical protein